MYLSNRDTKMDVYCSVAKEFFVYLLHCFSLVKRDDKKQPLWRDGITTIQRPTVEKSHICISMYTYIHST